MKTLILAEGKDDQMVLRAMLEAWGVQNTEVRSYDGRDKLRSYLKGFKASPDYTQAHFSKIIITRDNDDDPAAAWTSLHDHLRNQLNLNVGSPGELVPNDFGTKVTAFCVPNEGQSGMIETLCVDSLDEDQQAKLACVSQFVECVGKHISNTVHEKIRFKAWLLTSGNPRFDLKMAIKDAHFNFDAPCFSALKAIIAPSEADQ